MQYTYFDIFAVLFLCVYHTRSSQNYVVLDIPMRVICGEKNMVTSKQVLDCLLFFFFCCLQQKTVTKVPRRRHFWIPKSKKLSMYTFSCLCNGLSRSLVNINTSSRHFQQLATLFLKRVFMGTTIFIFDFERKIQKLELFFRIHVSAGLKFRVFAFVFIYKQSNYFFREIKIPINN